MVIKSDTRRSVLEEIDLRTYENPDKLLFSFLDIKGNSIESYTYLSFEKQTKNIASYIYTHFNLKKGDRILLAFPPGLEIIIAFFACVRLGYIPVPVYPLSAHGLDASILKMNFIAKDCNASAVITNSQYYWSYKTNLKRNSNYLDHLIWIASDEADRSELSKLPLVEHNEILFLQYTSGSTSNPKGVMVTHENIIQNCSNVVDHMPIGVSWLPQYHDMGLIGYYIFFAVKGGTTYGFSPSNFIQRPALWLETITKYKASASSAPNFAYDYCLIPGKITESSLASINLSSLKFLMTAAEPIKPATYRKFKEKFKPYGLKSNCFFGAYGLAEFTLAVTNYGRKSYFFDTALLNKNQAKIIDRKDEQILSTELMSCGKALFDTDIKIVDTDEIKTELKEGKIGEIWLDGASKCLGYWKRDELTKDTFRNEITGDKNGNEYLRTGDLGFIYEGELFVCGRLKDLIIIRGSNYYPQDIESIVEEDNMVRNGCTVSFTVGAEESKSVVVIAGLKSKSKTPDPSVIYRKINQLLGIAISEIVFVPARTISKTSSGKVKRYDNKQLFLNKELQIISQMNFEEDQTSFEGKQLSGLKSDLKTSDTDSYLSLLGRYKLSGNENAALGNAGLDSIKLAEFGYDLKTYLEKKGFEDLSQEVDLKLLQKIAISELVEILKTFESASTSSRFKFKRAFLKIQSEFEKAESSLMKKDSSLKSIRKDVESLPEYEASNGHIFLTAGTGFFGPFLIKSLLEQNEEDIHVLVRANSSEEGMNRLRIAFRTIQNIDQIYKAFEERVKPVCGDLSKEKLGISRDDYNYLSHHIHTIYHNGAMVNYLSDYQNMRNANVEGTKEVIQLAISARLKTLNHISTTFIFGWSVKDTLYESDSNQDMNFLDFGYSQSKWVSDQLIIKATQEGLRSRIFRPALISPSISGEGHNFDISIRLLTFMLKYGIGTTAKNQVSYTPADIAANNIVAIANIKESIGQTYHVTRDDFSSMQDITNALDLLSGKDFKNFKLKEFVPEVISRCQKEDILFPLLNFLVKSVDNISSMEFKKYDNRNYREFRDLSPWGKPDLPLEDVVKGIHIFLINNTLIAK